MSQDQPVTYRGHNMQGASVDSAWAVITTSAWKSRTHAVSYVPSVFHRDHLTNSNGIFPSNHVDPRPFWFQFMALHAGLRSDRVQPAFK